jgi:hypothetical protein
MEFIMPIVSSSKLEHDESKTRLDIQSVPNTDQITLAEALAQTGDEDFEFEPPRIGSLHKEIDLFKLLQE